VILDQRALVRYILKYQFKGEKASNQFIQAFKDILAHGVEAGDSTRKVMLKTMNKAIIARDFGAIETCHLVDGEDLVEFSRTTVRRRSRAASTRRPLPLPLPSLAPHRR
jgi:hypothetical protein